MSNMSSKVKSAVDADAQTTMKSHFMGGKQFGSVLLVFTYFSTVYSAITLDGVPAMARGYGYIALMWLTSAICVNISGCLTTPRCRRMAAYRHYNSPVDRFIDRFDNRILTWTILTLMVGSQICYIMTQINSARQILTTVGGGVYNWDPKAATWVMFYLILICEWVGGFSAVAITDSMQSTIMVVTLILIPIYATVYYGGMGGSGDLGCKEITGPLTAGRGCLRFMSGQDFKTLYPATGESKYFEPAYAAGVYGADSNMYFNNSASSMLMFNLLFLAFTMNPHWDHRVIAAGTDTAWKRVTILFQAAGYIATLPMMVMGIVVAANLSPGGNTFGKFSEELQSRGGFAAVVGTIAPVAACAAMMSTVDSSLIAISNSLTKELVTFPAIMKYQHHKVNLGFVEGNFVSMFGKLISFIIITIAICIGLYELGDAPETATNATNMVNGFLWQILPAALFMIYSPCTWRAIVVACVCGVTVFFIIYFGFTMPVLFSCSDFTCDELGKFTYNVTTGNPTKWEPNSFGSTCDQQFYATWNGPWTLDPDGVAHKISKLDPYAAMMIAGLVNLVVCGIITAIEVATGNANQSKSGGGFFSYPEEVRKQFDSNGEVLTLERINKHMKDEKVREIVFDPIGAACCVVSFILANASLPFYKDSYNGCNVATFGGFKMKVLMNSLGIADPTDPKLKLPGEFEVREPEGVRGDCDPEKLIGGVPEWAIVIIACYVVSTFLMAVAYSRWQPPAWDTENIAEAFTTPFSEATQTKEEQHEMEMQDVKAPSSNKGES
jgi:Na+/proline symporter